MLTKDGLYVVSQGVIDVFYRDDKTTDVSQKLQQRFTFDRQLELLIKEGVRRYEKENREHPSDNPDLQAKEPNIMLASAITIYDMFKAQAEVTHLERDIPILLPLQPLSDFYTKVSIAAGGTNPRLYGLIDVLATDAYPALKNENPLVYRWMATLAQRFEHDREEFVIPHMIGTMIMYERLRQEALERNYAQYIK